MEAVISGQAGLALLVDGQNLSSIHAHAPDEIIPRRPTDYNHLFGAAKDLVFVEDIEVDDARRRLAAAVDGDDLVHLAWLLLDRDRPEDIRHEAAEELGGIIAGNAAAADYAEYLLLSQPFPKTVDLEGANRYCTDPPARPWLDRLVALQPAIERAAEAWHAIPETAFPSDDAAGRERADGVFVREGVWRAFVLSAAGELEIGAALLHALNIPAVKALPTHRAILQSWRAALAGALRRSDAQADLSSEPGDTDGIASEHDVRKKRRPIDREEELARVERVKATIVDAMKSRDLRKVRKYIDKLVEEQIERSGEQFACMSLCSLARAAQDLGIHSLQLELTSRAVEICPGDAWAWSQHGKALLDNGRLQEAFEASSQAVFFDESNPVAKNGRAEALRSLGRLAEALAVYESVIAEHPEDVYAKTGRAEALRSLGRLVEALDAYDVVVQEHPEDVVAKNGRADTLRSMGRLAEALNSYDVVIQEHPEDVYAKNGRAETLRSLGRLAEALTSYDEVIRGHSENVVAKNGRAETLRSMGRLAEALDSYDVVIQEHPENIYAKNGRAETLRSLGRLAEALTSYDEVIREHPEDVFTKSGRAETLRSLGRLAEALASYDEVIRDHPENLVAKNGRAETLRSLGRLTEALASYDEVIREHPEDIYAKSGRAETLRSLGRLAEALAAYESVIAEHPEDGFANNGRACVLVEMGHIEQALRLLDVGAPVTYQDWIRFHIKGMTLLKANRATEAISVFETGLQDCPWAAQREYFASALAVARMKIGDFRSAKLSLDAIDAQQERSAVTLVRIHVLGMLSERTEARQTYDRLPETLPPIESELRDELGHRYVLGLAATRTDEWLFEREINCLLTAA